MALLTNVTNTVIGGTIQSVLFQQYTRSLSNLALWSTVMGGYNAPQVYIAGIPVSVRTQEVYQWKAEMTRYAIESGAIYSDHVILEPFKIDLYFEVSNILPGAAAYAVSLFEEMYKARQPVDLLTEFKKIGNMILTSLRVENQAPFWKRAIFQATFEQCNKVTLATETADVTPTAVTSTPNVQKSAEQPQTSGSQTPQSSALYDIFH